jgi:hypothetical protein
MPSTTITLNQFTYQGAAEDATWGRLQVPPTIRVSECRAYLLTFTKPAHEDRCDSPDYHRGVLIITGGSMGQFAATACVYACDTKGEPLTDDNERWIRLTDPSALPGPIDVTRYLRDSGLSV